MWRLLLARLHPDAGGDGELFAFACAVREGARGAKLRGRANARGGDRGGHAATPFMRSWRHTMGHWASSNRDALKGFKG